jgi:hypothetical protein
MSDDDYLDDLEDLDEIALAIIEGRDDYELPSDLLDDGVVPDGPKQNLQARIALMKVGERLKLALKGGRDARTILIRDPSRLVQRFVLQNPRISDEEVVAVAKNRTSDRELLEIISKKKEWLNNYQVRLSLVTNPKTPTTIAVRYVNTLLVRDLRLLAKSKNVPVAVNGAAKRIVIERSGRL